MTLSVLIITPELQAEINSLVAEARRHCKPWLALQDTALIGHESAVVTLEDRKGKVSGPTTAIEIGDHLVAFSFEEQPAGIVRHLSVSVPRKGRVPHPGAVEMIAAAFGFGWPDSGRGQVWLEEFEPGHHAVNLVELAEPAAPGTLQ